MSWKTRYLRLMVLEIDVPGYLRKGGKSSVRPETVVEFVRNIVRYRFGGQWRKWQQQVAGSPIRQAHAL